MLSCRLFWKLFIACAGLNVVAALIAGGTASHWQQERIRHNTRQRLQHAAITSSDELAALLADGKSEDVDRYVANLAKSSGLEYTVLDPRGSVVAQAGADAQPGSTKSPQPATRDSFSQPLTSAGQHVGTMNVSADPLDVRMQLRNARTLVWIVTAAVVVLAVLVSYAVAAHVVRPVVALGQAADAVTVGDYRGRIYVPHRDEIGRLARSFNRMSQELDARMAQLRQSSQRQSTVLGGMTEGVIAVDDRERVLFANSAAGRLFDFSPPAIEGRRLLEVVRIHALHEAVAAVLAERRPQRLEAEFETGDKLSIAIQATPLPGDPCPGAVLVLHDMTELRRLERVRQEFVANVSHELKTPLSSIKAYAETLQNGALDDRDTSQKFIRQIEDQADRLHGLILDMLTLARIESDQQAFDIVSVGVDEVVRACLEAHQAAADAKRITLGAEFEQPDLQVKADREGLREILDNLVDNAIKYTPDQGRVTVRCVAEEQFAKIAVEDTGIGIAEDEVSRVFERFYRVDKARSRELGGTGLGLSIVKHLTQSLGGKVGVHSKKGQGSTFSVSLPLA